MKTLTLLQSRTQIEKVRNERKLLLKAKPYWNRKFFGREEVELYEMLPVEYTELLLINGPYKEKFLMDTLVKVTTKPEVPDQKYIEINLI